MDTKTFLKIVGDKIRAIRKSKKLSQERLAELSGLHPTYVSDIENGKTNASIYSYYSIANALNIPFSDLINLPSGKPDRKSEAEIAEILSLFRKLDKKKQAIFLSAAKGLINGIEKT
jgi:transcriptional regulator with XRE-family HTH domain